MRPPHILFLMADEMDGRIFDPVSPQVKPPMPNLAALAAGGALFAVAYSESPQCVPSRSSMVTGRRTDEIRVWDNFVGVAGVNGSVSNVDTHCVAAYSEDECTTFARAQNVTHGTFFDVLNNGGYNVTLEGKMHVGAGLTRFPGTIGEFPFSHTGDKLAREWARGAGWTLNIKGNECGLDFAHRGSAGYANCVKASQASVDAPDDVAKPALAVDYAAVSACEAHLASGLLSPDALTPNLLYCSIIVPHPPYATNSTYLANVAKLSIDAVEQVPYAALHPNDIVKSILKNSIALDFVNATLQAHFRRIYLSMCTEADELLGRVLNALAAKGGSPQNTYVVMVSDHGEDNTEHRQNGKNNMYAAFSFIYRYIARESCSQ
jgi:arylsulfatase A-like enzyme